jgi:hypothetical protein
MWCFDLFFLASVSATRNKRRKHEMQCVVSKRVFAYRLTSTLRVVFQGEIRQNVNLTFHNFCRLLEGRPALLVCNDLVVCSVWVPGDTQRWEGWWLGGERRGEGACFVTF